jgi:hypothetical protein
VSELKEELKLHNLSTKGLKAELVQRLYEQEQLQQRELELTMALVNSIPSTPVVVPDKQVTTHEPVPEVEMSGTTNDSSAMSPAKATTQHIPEVAMSGTLRDSSAIPSAEVDEETCTNIGSTGEVKQHSGVVSESDDEHEAAAGAGEFPSPWWAYSSGLRFKAPLKLIQQSMDIEDATHWDSHTVSRKQMEAACEKAYLSQTVLPPTNQATPSDKVPRDSYDFSQCKSDSEVIEHFRDHCFIQNHSHATRDANQKESKEDFHLSHNFVWLRLRGHTALTEHTNDMAQEEKAMEQLDRLFSILKERESPSNPVLLVVLTQNEDMNVVKRLAGKK